MAAQEQYRFSIGCAAGGPCRPDHRATLEIELGKVERDYVHGCVRLSVDEHTYEDRRCYYGIDILHFLERLTALYGTLAGSARLCDWDGETVLCFTVVHRPSGEIAIGGRMIPSAFWSASMSEERFINSLSGYGGLVIFFDGLLTDQSYLPPLLTGLRRFLDETAISVKGPMME